MEKKQALKFTFVGMVFGVGLGLMMCNFSARAEYGDRHYHQQMRDNIQDGYILQERKRRDLQEQQHYYDRKPC